MIKSYVINLDRDENRLQFFTNNFKRLGLEFERISAVDGRQAPEQEFQDFMQLRPRNNKTWMRGQMGCFLSHFKAWELIANGNEEFCAIFEDDVHISDDLKFILQEKSWIPADSDIIRLETSTNRVRLSKSPVMEYRNRPIYKVMSTSWNAGGYILNRNTARKLIGLPFTDHQPSDVLLFHYIESSVASKLQILQFNPALCAQDKYHSSDINSFVSNIECDEPKMYRLMSALKKYSPQSTLESLRKSSQGYKRIKFQ